MTKETKRTHIAGLWMLSLVAMGGIGFLMGIAITQQEQEDLYQSGWNAGRVELRKEISVDLPELGRCIHKMVKSGNKS